MTPRRWLVLALFIALCEGVGLVGSLFTAPAIGSWYSALARPALTPPAWVFAPVWTILFLCMGTAVFLVWQHGIGRRLAKEALAVFALQLVLNVLWSALFFGLRNPGIALVEILVLWAAILWTLLLFNKVSRTAAVLLTPYLAWVTFAAYLNWMFFILN